MELPFPNDKERRIDLGLSFVESELFQDGKGMSYYNLLLFIFKTFLVVVNRLKHSF